MLYDFKCIIIVCNNQLQEAEAHGPVSYMDVLPVRMLSSMLIQTGLFRTHGRTINPVKAM